MYKINYILYIIFSSIFFLYIEKQWIKIIQNASFCVPTAFGFGITWKGMTETPLLGEPFKIYNFPGCWSSKEL